MAYRRLSTERERGGQDVAAQHCAQVGTIISFTPNWVIFIPQGGGGRGVGGGGWGRGRGGGSLRRTGD
jgi:hypothetical protein